MDRFLTYAVASSFLVAACSAPTAGEPTPTISPTEPVAEDGCDEARFAGTFAFPAVAHAGDTSYCEASAEVWNGKERPREMTFWQNKDQSWSSQYADAPHAGQTTYRLDVTSCTLQTESATRISDRNYVGASVAIPLRDVTTVKLTTDGVAITLTETLDAAPSMPDLPCTIASTTQGVRR